MNKKLDKFTRAKPRAGKQVYRMSRGVYRRQRVHIPQNAKCLQEAKVCIMDNEQCAKKWASRFRSIISEYMICTKDVMKRLSEICDKKYANCTDVENRRLLEGSAEISGKTFNVDLGRHLRDPDDYTARRSSLHGGFCENDHGGPLIVKYQGKERVIGVISACKIDPKSHSCHGPFLYTSVFKNRQFISCAIHKDVEDNCRRVFRSGITHEEWTVDWDAVEEDDADRKADSDDNDKDKQALRDLEKKKDAEEKKEKALDSSSSSSSSDEKVTEEKSKKDAKKQGKASKHGKSRHDKHQERKKESQKEETKAVEESKKKAKSSESLRGMQKGELFYESSKDENVNEPGELA